MRKPQNFFKHADRDPEGSLRFNPMLTAYLMMYGVHSLQCITGTRSGEGQVFYLWFYLRFPDRAPAELRASFALVPPDVGPDDYSAFLELIT